MEQAFPPTIASSKHEGQAVEKLPVCQGVQVGRQFILTFEGIGYWLLLSIALPAVRVIECETERQGAG